MVDQVLHAGEVTLAALATGAAMDRDHRGHRRFGAGGPGSVQNAGNLQSVITLEAHHFTFYQHGGIDLRVGGLSQLSRLSPQGHDVQVVGSGIAVQAEGDGFLVAAKAHLTNVTQGEPGQIECLARGGINNRHHGAGIDIGTTDPVAARG